MNKKVREPFFISRLLSMLIGIIILGLLVLVLVKDGGTAIYEMIIFALAAVENFIAAIICFVQQKTVRGNMYAIICAVFLIVALVYAARCFIFV